MSNVKALLVGVSNYRFPNCPDLPFCKNDVLAIESALRDGLKLEKGDIITCGKSGEVTESDFKDALNVASSTAEDEGILLFYFSGHGTTRQGKHHLVFTDALINTQDVIAYLEKVPAKGKVVFLDCCFSGNYSVDEASTLHVEETVQQFLGKGYAVFSSSNATQVSYGHPDKPVSVFTGFLCAAFEDRYIVRQGRVSLYDIHKLVALYLELWNKTNPSLQQNPIFRASMGGTLFFDVQEWKPYQVSRVYHECESYIIYNVQPVHSGEAKRYAVEVILKAPLSLTEICELSREINEKVKTAEVYSNEIAQKRWRGKPANIIWVYFGRDESDMISNRFMCHTTWVDEKQDKKWWYRVNGEHSFMVDGVHLSIHPHYEYLKVFREQNTATKEDIILETKELLSQLVTLAERVIRSYNEYRNGLLTELELVNQLQPYLTRIDEQYLRSTNLKFSPDEIHTWGEKCTSLFGTIHDLTLFYNATYLKQRAPENRIACMEMTVKRYYTDLDQVQRLEQQLL